PRAEKKKEKKAAPEAEKKEKEKKAEAEEPEAGKKEERARKEAEKEEAAEAGPDVSEIELPTVKELADFLADFEDVETIRALQERDDRKTAQRHYDARIEELTGEEG
ncbi:MAG: hypothetical protein ACLFWG_08985, partial [Longimicrobiales bacterium]